MRRTEQAQGLRLMKFEEVYARTRARLLSQAEASEMLGMSERTFRRWRDRFEADGAEGLYDRRLGRVSARRAAVDEVVRVLELFDTRYWDFTAKHFHEKLVAEHDVERSYNWVRLTLQAYGRMRPAPRRGAHRRKRLRRALPGMMLHQDGSRHAWVPGCWWDLIVTKIKHWMRNAQRRNFEDTWRHLGHLIATIEPRECQNYTRLAQERAVRPLSRFRGPAPGRLFGSALHRRGFRRPHRRQ